MFYCFIIYEFIKRGKIKYFIPHIEIYSILFSFLNSETTNFAWYLRFGTYVFG